MDDQKPLDGQRYRVMTYQDIMDYKVPEHVKIENGEIGFVKQNYWIELNLIKTRKQLIGWIHHLVGKVWITNEMLDQFIEKVHAYRKWNIYGKD